MKLIIERRQLLGISLYSLVLVCGAISGVWGLLGWNESDYYILYRLLEFYCFHSASTQLDFQPVNSYVRTMRPAMSVQEQRCVWSPGCEWDFSTGFLMTMCTAFGPSIHLSMHNTQYIYPPTHPLIHPSNFNICFFSAKGSMSQLSMDIHKRTKTIEVVYRPSALGLPGEPGNCHCWAETVCVSFATFALMIVSTLFITKVQDINHYFPSVDLKKKEYFCRFNH